MANYIHHVPGRLRVNIPVLKKDEVRVRQLKCHLEGMHGVLQAETSIVTGSVVIKYDPSLTNSAAILDSLRDLGYIRNVEVLNQPYSSHSLQKMADIFVTKLVETAVERSAVALVAALI